MQNEMIELDARLEGVIQATAFRARLGNGHGLVAYCRSEETDRAGELKPGDAVTVSMSPYDMSRGRIVWKKAGM